MDDHLTTREPPVSEFHWKLNPLNEHWINSTRPAAASLRRLGMEK
jgi:hypothetical protein